MLLIGDDENNKNTSFVIQNVFKNHNKSLKYHNEGNPPNMNRELFQTANYANLYRYAQLSLWSCYKRQFSLKTVLFNLF